MSNPFKLLVLAFLATDFADKYEQFNKAFELYKQTPTKNIALEAKLNRVGFTDEFLQALMYDLQQLNGVTDLEIAEKKKEVNAKVSPELLDVNFEEVEGTDEGGEFTDKGGEFTEEDGELGEDKLLWIGDENSHEKILREEFPFLNDPKCPDVMYVVVGKRIAAYKTYQALHARLRQIEEGKLELPEDEKTALIAETEAYFSENRALWDELNHFNTTGEILGKHELFRQNQLQKEVDEMSNEELLKYIGSSATFFSRKNGELKKAGTDEAKIAKITTAIKEREYKLKLVNEKLGVGK